MVKMSSSLFFFKVKILVNLTRIHEKMYGKKSKNLLKQYFVNSIYSGKVDFTEHLKKVKCRNGFEITYLF